MKSFYVILFLLLVAYRVPFSGTHPLDLSVLLAENSNTTESEPEDSCYEDRNSSFPCSSTIVGNLLLLVFYGLLLGIAAKLISDGAELLLDLGFPASIIGGIVLPLLGAVPDSAIIIASGMGADAQTKISVGMGTLAGSTIMLLTIAWGGSLILGRCDIDASTGEAVDNTGKRGFYMTTQGVTTLPGVRSGVIIMLITSTPYLLIQGADWYFGVTNFGPQPPYVRRSALATMIICFAGLFFYLVFLGYDSKAAEWRAEKHRRETMSRRVVKHMITIANRQTFKAAAPAEPSGSRATGDVQRKYFKAWHVGVGTTKPEPQSAPETESEPLIVKEPDVEDSGESEKEESKGVIAAKCVTFLALGVALVTVFADPMCSVLDALTDKKNKSHIPIDAFYVSFVVTPLCSNASELVSSLIFAAKKRRDNISITYSQLYGASTMNNTMCLGIFAALVYFRNLKWYYSAEVTVILLVQWFVGLFGLMRTYKVWLAFPIMVCYVLSIILVAILETGVGWK